MKKKLKTTINFQQGLLGLELGIRMGHGSGSYQNFLMNIFTGLILSSGSEKVRDHNRD